MTILLLELLAGLCIFMWMVRDAKKTYSCVQYDGDTFIALYIATICVMLITVPLHIGITADNYNAPYAKALENENSTKMMLYAFLDQQEPVIIEKLQRSLLMQGILGTLQANEFKPIFNGIAKYLEQFGIKDFLKPQRDGIMMLGISYTPDNDASCIILKALIRDTILFYRPKCETKT
jgi:hypothetical protein